MSQQWRIREATAEELANWDDLVVTNRDGGLWTQTLAYARYKQWDGLRTRYLVIEGAYRVYSLALEHRSPLGVQWNLLQGPGSEVQDIPGITDAIRRDGPAIAGRLISVLIQPFVTDTEEHREVFASAGYVPELPRMLNTYTVLVDIDKSDDEIFASFHKRLRNHIRSAEKNGYVVERVEDPTEETYEKMWKLMQTVAGGKGSKNYREYEAYRQYWLEFHRSGQALWWFGYDGEEGPQAGSFMISFGKYLVAKDGGSRPDRAIRGGHHLMRWRAIQWAKEHTNAEIYDAFGATPQKDIDNQDHPFYAITQTKKRFGPLVDHVRAQLLVIDRTRHNLFMRAWLPIEWRVRRRPGGVW